MGEEASGGRRRGVEEGVEEEAQAKVEANECPK